MSQYKTTAAYLSGAICGPMWWPVGALCGKPLRKDLRGIRGFYSKGDTFRDALDSLLMKEGGDFRHAQFTADTVIRIERKRIDAPGKWSLHVKEIELVKSAPNLVNEDAYTGDFLGED